MGAVECRLFTGRIKELELENQKEAGESQPGALKTTRQNVP